MAAPETLRAFVAVRIPQNVRMQLLEIQNALKPRLKEVSWTHPDSMHLTLQFLGNIERANVAPLISELSSAAGSRSGFELGLGKIGSFGNRVLWAGVTLGEEPLQDLTSKVQRATASFGVQPEDRPFHPHVTLGRCRSAAPGIAAALAKLSLPSFEPWSVRSFELIQSELLPRGARYSVLASVTLGTK
jgi:RNA 2',3'-cyclic 3'-phosphodiesterase